MEGKSVSSDVQTFLKVLFQTNDSVPVDFIFKASIVFASLTKVCKISWKYYSFRLYSLPYHASVTNFLRFSRSLSVSSLSFTFFLYLALSFPLFLLRGVKDTVYFDSATTSYFFGAEALYSFYTF